MFYLDIFTQCTTGWWCLALELRRWSAVVELIIMVSVLFLEITSMVNEVISPSLSEWNKAKCLVKTFPSNP